MDKNQNRAFIETQSFGTWQNVPAYIDVSILVNATSYNNALYTAKNAHCSLLANKDGVFIKRNDHMIALTEQNLSFMRISNEAMLRLQNVFLPPDEKTNEQSIKSIEQESAEVSDDDFVSMPMTISQIINNQELCEIINRAEHVSYGVR